MKAIYIDVVDNVLEDYNNLGHQNSLKLFFWIQTGIFLLIYQRLVTKKGTDSTQIMQKCRGDTRVDGILP